MDAGSGIPTVKLSGILGSCVGPDNACMGTTTGAGPPATAGPPAAAGAGDTKVTEGG